MTAIQELRLAQIAYDLANSNNPEEVEKARKRLLQARIRVDYGL